MGEFIGKHRDKRLFAPVCSLAVCGVSVLLLAKGMSFTSATAQTEQRERVESALKHSMLQCYAMEGQYPSSLQELSEGYGFVVPEGYFVDYQYMGPNILPQVVVLDEEVAR